MRKIINFIVLLLFISTFTSNYSYSNKPVNKGNDKLALMRGLAREEACDILFNDLDEIIEFSSGKTGRELADELVDTYSRIKDSTDIIKKINIKSEDKENVIRLIIEIKTENKDYTNKIIIHKKSGIIWDKTNKEIVELCDKLTKVGLYIYLRAINNRLHEYYDKKALNNSDIETLFSVLKTIKPKIEKFENISPENFAKNDKQSEKFLNQYMQTVRIIFRNIWNRNLEKIRAKEFIDPLINTLTTIKNNKKTDPSLKQILIYNLIFLYDKKSSLAIKLGTKSIRNLLSMATELIKRSSTFDEKKRTKNLGWIASILIKQGLYNKTYKVKKKQIKMEDKIDNIIKHLDETFESNSTVFIEREILGCLGSIAKDLIDQGYPKNAYDLIIEKLKQIAENPEYAVPVRTKAIGQLFGRGAQLVKKANELRKKRNYNYNKYLKYIPKITTSIKITDAKTTNRVITRKCIAEVGAILLAYARFGPDKKKEIENLEKYIKQFEGDKDEDGIEVGATARRILDALAAIRKERKEKAKEEKKKAEKRKQKEERKKSEDRKLKKQKKLRDLKKRYKRRKKDFTKHETSGLIIDPKIRNITKKFLGKNYLKRIEEDKYLIENYKINILPLFKHFKDLKVNELHHPFKDFAKPMKKLRQELQIANKHISYEKLIDIIPNSDTKKEILLYYIDFYNRKVCSRKNIIDIASLRNVYLFNSSDLLSKIISIPYLFKAVETAHQKITTYTEIEKHTEKILYNSIILEKICVIQKRLEEEGRTNTIEYKELIKIKEKYYVHDLFTISKKGTLNRLQELGLVYIKDGYLIKNVHNWPENITYILFPKSIDNMEKFISYLNLFKGEADRIKLDILLSDEELFAAIESNNEQTKIINRAINIEGINTFRLLIRETEITLLINHCNLLIEWFEGKDTKTYLNKTKISQNNSSEMLLIRSIEEKNYEITKQFIENGVCLDIWKTDGTNLFKIAANIAMRDKDINIFELLVSRIIATPIFDPRFKFDKKVEKLKEDIKKYISFLYRNEILYYKEIDIIKDFDKLNKLRKLNNLKRFINSYILALRFKNFMLKKTETLKTIRSLINEALFNEQILLQKLLTQKMLQESNLKPKPEPNTTIFSSLLNMVYTKCKKPEHKTIRDKTTRTELEKKLKTDAEISRLKTLINIFTDLVYNMYGAPDYTIPSLEDIKYLRRAV